MSKSPTPSDPAAKPDYGMDGPDFLYGFLLAGAIGLTTGFLLRARGRGTPDTVASFALLAGGGVCAALGAMMTAYWLGGKLRVRDYLLNRIAWRGDETVLDVGVGRGLLAIGAAKRLTTGRVIGIDIWNAADLSGNGAAGAARNAAIEGVSDKIELVTADARRMGFADASFDVVLSLLCLHNIEPESDRTVACHEIARVLKPGGTVLIGDYVPTGDYAKALADAGLTVRSTAPRFVEAYSLMWVTEAVKPGA